jgi:hypothetical protein
MWHRLSALTSLTSGDYSVGIVRSRTQASQFKLLIHLALFKLDNTKEVGVMYYIAATFNRTFHKEFINEVYSKIIASRTRKGNNYLRTRRQFP